MPAYTFTTLLCSPYCWTSGKIIDFLTKSFDRIKESQSSTIQTFVATVNRDAISRHIWPQHTPWPDIVCPQRFDILRHGHAYFNPIWETQCTHLLRIIRNGYSHRNNYTDADKDTLGWYTIQHGDKEFDETKYAQFWTERFPSLLPFLWDTFQIFRGEELFAQFYPNLTGLLYSNSLYFTPHNFVNDLWIAVSTQIDLGLMDARYSVPGSTERTLEFTRLMGSLVQYTTAQATCIQIVLSQRQLSFKWNDKVGCELHYATFYPTGTTGAIVIADKYEHVQSVSTVSRGACRVVITTNADFPKDITKMEAIGELFFANLISKPVTLADLTESKRNDLLQDGDYKFKLQRGQVKLSDILPNSPIERDSIAALIKGDYLNSLLQKQLPELLAKQKLPDKSEIYFCRNISKGIVVKANFFQRASPQDVFAISNITKTKFEDLCRDIDEMQDAIRQGFHCVATYDEAGDDWINSSNYKIFLFKNESPNILEYFKKFKIQNVHHFHYLQSNSFEWQVTKFSNVKRSGSSVDNEIVNFLLEGRKQSEHDFLVSHESGGAQAGQFIFIADMPGMGKSQVLISLANEMSLRMMASFTILLMADELLHLVKGKELDQTDVMNIFAELVSSNEFETSLVKYWLAGVETRAKMKIDIMVDGLDEVGVDDRDMLVNALKIIKRELHCTRIWLSLRDNMLSEMSTEINSFGYKLEPFTDKQQINYICTYWQNSNLSELGVTFSLEQLQKFAKKCLQLPLPSYDKKIAGTPLICRLLAEKYLENVQKQDLAIDEDELSLTNLYQYFYEKMLKRYLAEKKGMLISDEKDNDLILKSLSQQMERFHAYFAIEMIFSKNVANVFVKHLIRQGEFDKDWRKLNADILLRGVIQKLEPLTFLHRTFAEYIVARFCHKVISGQFDLIDSKDDIFQSFLWEELLAVGENVQLKHPVVVHFFNELFDKKDENILSIFADLLNPEYDCGSLGGDVNSGLEYLWQEQVGGNVPLFKVATEKQYSTILTLLMDSRNQIFNLFTLALKHQNFALAKLFIEHNVGMSRECWLNLDCLDDNEKDKSKHVNECRNGILHFVVEGLENFYEIVELYTDYSHTLPETKDDVLTHMQINVRDFVKYICMENELALKQKNRAGQTPAGMLEDLKCESESYENYAMNVFDCLDDDEKDDDKSSSDSQD